MSLETLFTSESVTEGHPDKVADQISDAVLDTVFAEDPESRVACETFLTTGQVSIAGEITTNARPDIARIARRTLLDIGYNDYRTGFHGNAVAVSVSMDEQSPDIAMGVDDAYESRGEQGDELEKVGAGDQGMMFGYACDETDALMPMPIHLAHRMSERLATLRHNGTLPFLLPDAKTQVTIGYDQHNEAESVKTVVLSTHHTPEISLDDLRPQIEEQVVKPLLPDSLDRSELRVLVNPTGRFEVGGPIADAGLTGRKIIVDTYGGMARHGGGAFSGKDCTKVDRSAAYAARWVAKNVVAAGLARKAEVQLAYAIGVARPVSMYLDTFGTETADKQLIYKAINEVFDLRPGA
ncbi:MAG: methionine adenosyltransferase, partial [Actinobacteria bacterium QS_5_72_10]